MKTFEAIKTMLAVRSYQDKPIPADVVTRIVEAGRLTGSSKNTQQWDFVVVQNRETLQKLGRLAASGSYIAQAPLAIAVVVPNSTVGHIDGARATQDMMLAAWAKGIGSNWVGNVNTEPIKTLLNIPQDKMVLNIIPFGYPTETVGQGVKKRKPLAKVAHREKLGQPYPQS